MIEAPFPADEAGRLEALERYRLAGIGREAPFDRITQIAAESFGVSYALVSIVGPEEQCFRGGWGLDESGTPRSVAFCAHAILAPEVMVVEDALRDERFHDNPLVTGHPSIRFYAGAPVIVDGHALGTLCLLDSEPRAFDVEEQERLARLARVVADLIELRVGALSLEEERAHLAEQRELLTLTVENVVEGVALVDGGLRMVVWNQAFCDMFGYEPGLVQKGMNAGELMRLTARRGDLGPGDPDIIVDDFISSIKSSDSRRIEIRRKDGRILDIWRKSINGRRFILTARDVTEERQMARLKDELVSTVSHELRTPLTAIAGSLGLMAGGAAGQLPPGAERLVKIAHKNSDRLIRLVNDLLDMDKLQSGKAEFNFADRDLGELLRDAVEQNAPFAERFGVALKLELPERPVVASVDPHRIAQAMANLISNAAKFSGAGTEVRISLDEHGRRARISVADEGPGIPKAFQSRLFSRFAQADASSERSQDGTGLGLAITKNIVERHGGTIELDTAVARGATFHVYLPLAGAAEA